MCCLSGCWMSRDVFVCPDGVTGSEKSARGRRKEETTPAHWGPARRRWSSAQVRVFLGVFPHFSLSFTLNWTSLMVVTVGQRPEAWLGEFICFKTFQSQQVFIFLWKWKQKGSGCIEEESSQPHQPRWQKKKLNYESIINESRCSWCCLCV